MDVENHQTWYMYVLFMIPAWYINFLIGLNGLGLLATVFVFNQHHKKPGRPVYKCIRNTVLKYMTKGQDDAAAECNIPQPTDAPEDGPCDSEDPNTTTNANNSYYAEQWACFARLLDRLFFVLYMCIMFLGALGFLLITV